MPMGFDEGVPTSAFVHGVRVRWWFPVEVRGPQCVQHIVPRVVQVVSELIIISFGAGDGGGLQNSSNLLNPLKILHVAVKLPNVKFCLFHLFICIYYFGSLCSCVHVSHR